MRSTEKKNTPMMGYTHMARSMESLRRHSQTKTRARQETARKRPGEAHVVFDVLRQVVGLHLHNGCTMLSVSTPTTTLSRTQHSGIAQREQRQRDPPHKRRVALVFAFVLALGARESPIPKNQLQVGKKQTQDCAAAARTSE